MELAPGEATVFASKHSCQGQEFEVDADDVYEKSRVFKMKTRLRVLLDGGFSRTNSKA